MAEDSQAAKALTLLKEIVETLLDASESSAAVVSACLSEIGCVILSMYLFTNIFAHNFHPGIILDPGLRA